MSHVKRLSYRNEKTSNGGGRHTNRKSAKIAQYSQNENISSTAPATNTKATKGLSESFKKECFTADKPLQEVTLATDNGFNFQLSAMDYSYCIQNANQIISNQMELVFDQDLQCYLDFTAYTADKALYDNASKLYYNLESTRKTDSHIWYKV